MYRVTAKNGFVVECETVTEVRALLGESPSATVERTKPADKPVRRDRGRAKGKKGMGSGPKYSWAFAAWYAKKQNITRNEARSILGEMKKDDKIAYAKLELEFKQGVPA